MTASKGDVDMVTFSELDKSQKEQYLPVLFDLLYGNMQTVAPSSLTYDAQREKWLSHVSPALDKEPRKILLCFSDGALAGYVQYYIREDLLMVEELQLKREFQRSLVFYRLCRYLGSCLPAGIRYIEAYAERQNLYSQRLMNKLGMEHMEDENGFAHLRGDLDAIRGYFGLSSGQT